MSKSEAHKEWFCKYQRFFKEQFYCIEPSEGLMIKKKCPNTKENVHYGCPYGEENPYLFISGCNFSPISTIEQKLLEEVEKRQSKK